MLELQDVRLDIVSRRAWRKEIEVRLAPKEFDLLCYLMERPDVVVSRGEIAGAVWHADRPTKTIDVHLGWLRRKLSDDARRPTLIRTVRGKGICFNASSRATPGERP